MTLQIPSVWYHGTDTDNDLDIGDELDPRKGQFTNAVWITSSRKVALGFAKDTAALHDSEPVVYEIVLREGSRVELSDEVNTISTSRMQDAPRFESKADAILLEEFGELAMAVLTRGTAKIIGRVT